MTLDYTPPEEVVANAYDADRPPPFQPELFAPFPIAVITIQPVPQYVAPVVPTDLDIEERISRAEGVLTRLLLQKRPVAVSWSAGKDSSAVLSLLLVAAVKLRLDGHALPPIVVVHSDTGVENPEMSLYARSEMLQVAAYAKRHDLPVTVSVAHPNLTSQWAVRVIGGRALPTFPGTNRDCSVSLKIEPMKKLRNQVLKKLAHSTNTVLEEPCVLIGTRYEESTARGANMTERGESDVEIRRGIDENGKPSHLFLSPIAYWTTDDVWMYLAMARSGEIDSYSSFEETFRVYADSMGTSCVIVAEDMYKALKNSRACGARTGCSVCTAVGVDKSMENMLSGDERYAYMRGLNDLRNFLTNTRWDMGRRSWLGRTIKHGYIKIAADAYSPNMMEELLRYALTIDANEVQASRRAGVAPRFRMVGVEQIFAIDAMWSLQAFHRPFHALKIWRDVHDLGERYPVPKMEPFKRPLTMDARYLYVGQDWEQGDAYTYTGLRSVVHDLVAMDSEGCMGNKVLANGKEVLDVNTGQLLSFDVETAFFVLDDLERLLKLHHDNPNSCPTTAYIYYATLGMMEVKSGMQNEIDQMLRRSQFKRREGLDGQMDVSALWARAVSANEAGLAAAQAPKTRVRGAAGSRSVAHVSLEASFHEDVGALMVERAEEAAPASPQNN